MTKLMVKRNSEVEAKTAIWAIDMAIVTTEKGPYYIAKVADKSTNKIVGYTIGIRGELKLIKKALLWAKRRQSPGQKVCIEVDQSRKFYNQDFQEWCRLNRFTIKYRNAIIKHTIEKLLLQESSKK